MTDVQSLFRVNMKYFRLLRGYTQAELAERCDLSSNYICEMEAGRRFPSADSLDALCDALDIQAFELFLEESGGDQLAEREPLYALKLRLRNHIAKALEEFV